MSTCICAARGCPGCSQCDGCACSELPPAALWAHIAKQEQELAAEKSAHAATKKMVSTEVAEANNRARVRAEKERDALKEALKDIESLASACGGQDWRFGELARKARAALADREAP